MFSLYFTWNWMQQCLRLVPLFCLSELLSLVFAAERSRFWIETDTRRQRELQTAVLMLSELFDTGSDFKLMFCNEQRFKRNFWMLSAEQMKIEIRMAVPLIRKFTRLLPELAVRRRYKFCKTRSPARTSIWIGYWLNFVIPTELINHSILRNV